MLTIERYIIGEVRRPVLMMVGFLTFVFASYSAERYLADAADGVLALSAVLSVVFYKVIIALEMLLPVGLYASVAIALGRLYSDSEVTAILASGSSPLRLYGAVLLIAAPLAVLKGSASLINSVGTVVKNVQPGLIPQPNVTTNTTTTLSGTGTLGGGSYSTSTPTTTTTLSGTGALGGNYTPTTTDRHDSYTATPTVVTQPAPLVVQPAVVNPVIVK